jgi:CheY-like chemotaxis protein
MDAKNRPSSTNILLIDDESLSVFICEKIIKKVKKDSEVTFCANGKFAIDKLIEIKNHDINLLPDYIFLDISMPIMNGWEFLEQYDNLNIDPMGKCKIYILSSSIFQSDIKKSTSYHAIKDYITKPLDFEKLKKVFVSAN